MADITRMMQRLDQRGRFALTMEMQPRIARTYRTPGTTHGTTSEYTNVSYPVWRATLDNEHPRGWVWTLMGFAHEEATGDDLETVLADLLAKTEPRYVRLEDRVWDHLDFRHECEAYQLAADLAVWLESLEVAA